MHWHLVFLSPPDGPARRPRARSEVAVTTALVYASTAFDATCSHAHRIW
jgi:hypothetical protein